MIHIKNKNLSLSLVVLAIIIVFNSCGNKEPHYIEEEGVIYTSIVHHDNRQIQYTGRVYIGPEYTAFGMSGCQILTRFEGSFINMIVKNYSPDTGIYYENLFSVYIDDKEPLTVKLNNKDTLYELAANLDPGKHILRIVKRTEAACGNVEFYGFMLEENKGLLTPPIRPKRRIEFIGNSVVAGYGVEAKNSDENYKPETENIEKSFAHVTSGILKAEYFAICYSGLGVYRNYDNSWDQNINELYYRIYPQHGRRWDFSTWIPEVIVVNLGTNDFALGLPDSNQFIEAYKNMLLLINEKNPEAKVICLDGPMISNSWPLDEKTNKPLPSLKLCRSYIKSAILETNNLGIENIYQFSLTTSGDLGYGADWHPSEAQHKANGEELATYIRSLMEWE